MKISYEIPRHLEGVFEGLQESKLQSLITVVLEYAVQHRMIDMPKMHIEKQVDSILQQTKKLELKSDKSDNQMINLLLDVNSKLDRLLIHNPMHREFAEEDIRIVPTVSNGEVEEDIEVDNPGNPESDDTFEEDYLNESMR